MLGSDVLVSGALAFTGGALALLAPCGALLLPAFFSYAFGSRRQALLTMATFYYLGLVALFVPLGLGLTFLLRLTIVQRGPLFLAIGLAIVALGLLTIVRPVTLPMPLVSRPGAPRTDAAGMFALGLTSGLTTGTCTAPILGSILTLAAGSQTYWTAAVLLLLYAAGMVAALLVFALFFNQLARPFSRWWSTWELRLRWGGRALTVPGQQMVRGLLVVGVGILFTATQGSFGLEDAYQRLGLTTLAYRLNLGALQTLPGLLSVGAPLLLLAGMLFFMRRQCLRRQCAVQPARKDTQ